MPSQHYTPLQPGKCPYCREGFELFHSSAQQPLEVCPTCGTPVKLTIERSTNIQSFSSSSTVSEAKSQGFGVYKRTQDGSYERQ